MPDCGWTLHPQLAADTTVVGELALSRVLAVNAADYPWLVLVPRRPGVVELTDLGGDAFPLMAEIALASLTLKEVTQCDKINVAAIGNVVPQLHIHVVARCKTRSALAEADLGRRDAARRRRRDVRAFYRRDAGEARRYGGRIVSGEYRVMCWQRWGPGEWSSMAEGKGRKTR